MHSPAGTALTGLGNQLGGGSYLNNGLPTVEVSFIVQCASLSLVIGLAASPLPAL